jgi:hypothetical protein
VRSFDRLQSLEGEVRGLRKDMPGIFGDAVREGGGKPRK